MQGQADVLTSLPRHGAGGPFSLIEEYSSGGVGGLEFESYLGAGLEALGHALGMAKRLRREGPPDRLWGGNAGGPHMAQMLEREPPVAVARAGQEVHCWEMGRRHLGPGDSKPFWTGIPWGTRLSSLPWPLCTLLLQMLGLLQEDPGIALLRHLCL